MFPQSLSRAHGPGLRHTPLWSLIKTESNPFRTEQDIGNWLAKPQSDSFSSLLDSADPQQGESQGLLPDGSLATVLSRMVIARAGVGPWPQGTAPGGA